MSNHLSEITLLYVEDEASIRDEFVDIIESEVHNLHVAKNGEEGLFLKARLVKNYFQHVLVEFLRRFVQIWLPLWLYEIHLLCILGLH